MPKSITGSARTFIIAATFLVVAGIVGFKVIANGQEETPLITEESTAAPKDSGTAADTPDTPETAEETAGIDGEAALKERTLGDPNAPVTIREHSSLTCGHCAAFHKDTFKALKETFIDTGKVYLIFTDFPLNAPALHAGMVARCLPEERYFDFVQLLFETQENWASEASYLKYLKQNAQLVGLDGDQVKACLQSTALQEGLLKRMQESQTKFEISSTPTFVINEETVIRGNAGIEGFTKAIETELAKHNNNN